MPEFGFEGDQIYTERFSLSTALTAPPISCRVPVQIRNPPGRHHGNARCDWPYAEFKMYLAGTLRLWVDTHGTSRISDSSGGVRRNPRRLGCIELGKRSFRRVTDLPGSSCSSDGSSAIQKLRIPARNAAKCPTPGDSSALSVEFRQSHLTASWGRRISCRIPACSGHQQQFISHTRRAGLSKVFEKP